MKLLMIRRRAALIGLTFCGARACSRAAVDSRWQARSTRPSKPVDRLARARLRQPVLGRPAPGGGRVPELAGYSFKAVSGQGKPESQSATLRQLADQGTNVVMLNPVDPKALVPAVKYAEEQGNEGPERLRHHAVRERERRVRRDPLRPRRRPSTRRRCSRSATARLTGKVAVLEGILGQPASDLRAKGFIDWMKAHGVQIVATAADRLDRRQGRRRRCRTGSSSTRTCRWSTA